MELTTGFTALFLIVLADRVATDNYIDQYVDLIQTYFTFKHTSALTHFTCFTKPQNAYIDARLSDETFQSKFVFNFMTDSRIIDTPEHSTQGYVVNTACENFISIFSQESHSLLFKNNNFWIFIDFEEGNWTQLPPEYEAWLSTLQMLPVSESIFAKRFKQQSDSPIDWILFDVYKIALHFALQVSVFAFICKMNMASPNREYCPSEGSDQRIFITEKFQSKSTRDDLQGLTLKCGLVIAYPERYTYLEDERVENVDIFTKGTATVAANMRENLNMSCDIMQVDSYGWNINGTFNGVMGLFQRKKIQMLSHATIMREDRLKAVEFTAEVFVIETPFIFRQPPLSAITNIFILPLDIEVWRCCAVIMVVVMFNMFAQLMHPMLRTRMSIMDVVSFVWGAVCQQGTHLFIPNTSGRFIVLTTFLATLAIFTSYSASIVALLQSPSHLIKNIDDLLASPLKMALQEAGYNRYNYLMENISILNKIYDTRIRPMGPNGWVYDPFVGVEKIRTELFAFQVEAASAYKAVAKTYTESEKCSLSEIHVLRLAVTTVTVERNSPYKELVKRRLRWQRENGIMNRYKRRWFPKKPLCEGGARGFLIVGLQEIKPALILLLIGVVVSLVIMISEILIHKTTRVWLSTGTKKLKTKENKTEQIQKRDWSEIK